MGVFDIQKAVSILGGGGNPIAAIGMGFGVPNCVTGMASDILKSIPSGMLGDFSRTLLGGREQAMNAVYTITQNMLLESGLMVVETEDGQVTLQSDSSRMGIDSGESQGLANTGGFTNALAYAIGGGSQVFNNIGTTLGKVNDLYQCTKKYKAWKASKKGAGALANAMGNEYGYAEAGNILAGGYCSVSAGVYLDEGACITAGYEWVPSLVDPWGIVAGGDPTADATGQFSIMYEQLQTALAFANKCDEQMQIIGQLLQERLEDPSKEPCILLAGGGTCSVGLYDNKEECEDNGGVWTEYLDGIPAALLDGTTICAATKPEYELLQNPPDDKSPSAIFDLIYGPPISKDGQFILTADGLYYDSQSGGVPDVIGFVPPAEFYKFEQPANLGGKGKPISSKDLNLFIDTIFDPEIVDESAVIQVYYDNDHFLKMLKGERDKHINKLHIDLSAMSVAGSSIAIVANAKQEIYSQLALHEDKIRRRKKQLEVAAKASTLYGSEVITPGNVPINDFSFLTGLNLIPTLEQQKNLIFTQADVSEVVLPFYPKFVKGPDAGGTLAIQHLVVPTIGKGSIVYDASTEGGLSTGTPGSGTLYSLTDEIVTDHLLAVYNFLNADIEDPSSGNYGTMNCASMTNLYGNAQLLAEDVSSTFVSGLAIPRLKGLVKYKSNGFVRGLGSAVKLPDITEFKDLFYEPSGMTFEAWIHLPGLGSSSTSFVEPAGEWGPLTLNRVLLGCENNGGIFHTADSNNLPTVMGVSVLGFLMGFTRDQQLTLDKVPTNNISDTDNPLSGAGFFIAPTTSYNGSGVGFVSKQGTEECSPQSPNYRKLFIKGTTTVSGVSINDVSSNFVHLCTTFSPLENTITVYLDGVQMVVSSLPEVFGNHTYQSPNLPSFKKSNSFEYNKNTVNANSTAFSQMINTKLTQGPHLNELFTPWILGGGYTDGLLLDTSGAGFMGALHGVKSGLNGFVGSVKFYTKPLNSKEVLKNYKAQKGFFKNIKT